MTNLIELFKDEIWKPEDYTSSWWQKTSWGIRWSEEGDNPDEWEDEYSSERTRCKVERDGFILIELDDDCGGIYQAFFDKSKEVKDE
ncbi:hypothetical protein D3C85_1380250 [compost metagenome]